jgi:hypothetical protein
MSLACRFCHPDPITADCPSSYAAVLSFGSKEGIAVAMQDLEAMRTVIPGHCVQCEVCRKHSLISYALVFHMYPHDVEPNAMAHYANLCTSFKMSSATAAISSDMCDELEDACDCEE